MPVEIKRLQAGPKGTAGNSTVGDLVEVANALNDAAVAADGTIWAMQSAQAQTSQALNTAQDLLSAVSNQVGVEYSGVERIVFLGASLMASMFPGNSLTIPSAAATAEMRAAGYNIDVYGWAVSGDRVSDTTVKLQAAFDAFPDDGKTLYITHTMGNNVSTTRPFDTMTVQELADLNADLDALFAVIAQRPDSVFVASTSFRAYANPRQSELIFNDESLGSKPYNDNLLIPRIADILPHAINIDGNPIIDYYNHVREVYEEILEDDGIHILADKRAQERTWILGRIMGILPAPKYAPVIRSAAKPAEIYTINFSAQSDRINSTINTLTHTGLTTTKTLSIKRDGASETDATYRLIVPDGIPSGTSGIASSATDGGITGLPVSYSGGLLCEQLVTDKVYVAAAYTVDHEFSGLKPLSNYDVAFVGSRVVGDVRTTRLANLANSEFIDAPTSVDPAVLSPVLTVTTDAEGKFTLRQSASAGTLSYINAIQLVKA